MYAFTAPGLSFAAALKISKIRLELLTDIDMVLFFFRGGITQAFLRYVQANNKFLPSFDINSYLFYVDGNNLYSNASISHFRVVVLNGWSKGERATTESFNVWSLSG